MKKNSPIFFILFLLPTAALIIAIIRHKSVDEPILITASQLHQTQAAWTNQVFIPISTNAEFIAKIRGIQLVDKQSQFSSAEIESLRQATVNLVFANYLGDYREYRKFRTPIPNFELPPNESRNGWEAWFRTAIKNTPIPSSFDDVISSIWVQVYGGHPYWIALGLDKSEISLITTNKIFDTFDMNLPDKKNAYCMESISQGTYSYRAIIQKNFLKDGQLKIAKLFFWVDTTDPLNKPRPFLYVMVLDTDSNVWLPIEIAQCSTTGSKNPVLF
jgi:hypothetical protein